MCRMPVVSTSSSSCVLISPDALSQPLLRYFTNPFITSGLLFNMRYNWSEARQSRQYLLFCTRKLNRWSGFKVDTCSLITLPRLTNSSSELRSQSSTPSGLSFTPLITPCSSRALRLDFSVSIVYSFLNASWTGCPSAYILINKLVRTRSSLTDLKST